MSGIITFGVEWETNLLVVNTTGDQLLEKVPYVLGNDNTNAKNQYSLEGYHPPRPRGGQPDRTQEYRAITNQCMYVLEFIFGVFNSVVEFQHAMQEFSHIVNMSLCQAQPGLQITQSNGQIQNSPIVQVMDYPEGRLENVWTDCSLRTAKPQGPGLGVYFADQCPVAGKGQLTIGLDFVSMGRLLAFMVRSPLMPPGTTLSKKQNFRDSGFKMASHFLYNVMASPPHDPLVSVLCFWMVYPIMNQFRSRQFSGSLEYFKMLLPLKGRSNFTCLVKQLSPEQQAEFEYWYDSNSAFLAKFFPKVKGYKFLESYPDLNINAKYIYSADIQTGIAGLSDIAIDNDSVTFTYNGEQKIGQLRLKVVSSEFMVWYGRLAPLRAVSSSDQQTLLFEGVGNPAFESADVNEWCIGPPTEGATYNVVEVRELDKFFRNPGAELGATPIPRLKVETLYDVIGNVLGNLQEITTKQEEFQLRLSPQDYDQYVRNYLEQDVNTAKTKVVDAMDAAMSEYADTFLDSELALLGDFDAAWGDDDLDEALRELGSDDDSVA